MAVIPEDALGAFCRHTHIALRGSGSGLLAGLTFGAKDIYDVAGYQTGFGSPEWLATHEPAAHTAPAIEMLLGAGADMAGKTQTDELTFSITGENAHYGTPVNVNAPGRVPGGSSSGSAAAVAGSLVDFSIGSDTGGSVRAPASFCGLYGIRPTHGRVPMAGVCPMAPSFDVAGWFARDAALLERVGTVLLQEQPVVNPKSLRGLLAEDAFALVSSDVTSAMQPVLERVRSLFSELRPVTVSAEGLPQWFQAFRVLQGAEFHSQHGEWIARVKPQLGPGVRERAAWAAGVTEGEVSRMQAVRDMVRRRMDGLLMDDTVLLLPTVPDIAPHCNTPSAQLDNFRARAMSLLCIAGLAGLPQISLPLATLNGCPLGLSILGARGSDARLLALAKQIGG